MEILEFIILGVIQGLTEFLPVSSSGHLVLFQRLSGDFSSSDLLLDVFLHLGTLAAVLVFCFREVKMILRALTHFWKRPENEEQRLEKSLLIAIIIATIPTAIIGFTIKYTLVDSFANLFFLAVTFAITTTILILSSRFKGNDREVKNMPALFVGIAQGLAVLPGISRSGITIITGQAMGVQRTVAARFAFVMSIPAILGASIISIFDISSIPEFNSGLIISLICGMIAAAIVGYFSLVLLARIIEKARLSYFAFYTGAVSIFCIVWGFIEIFG